MRSPFAAWQRKPSWWVPSVIFLLLNLCGLGFYYSSLAGRVERLEGVQQVATQELAALQAERQQVEAFLARAQGGQQGITELYARRFASEAERFTRVQLEIKRLARQAGLNPRAFAYPRTALEDYGLIKRNIEFGVDGTYDQLRTFINYLEFADQFLALERVTMNQSGQDPKNPVLGIRLAVSTLFVAEPGQEVAAAPDAGAAPLPATEVPTEVLPTEVPGAESAGAEDANNPPPSEPTEIDK